jgi:hypothetical protein
MKDAKHLTMEQLEAGLDHIRRSPDDNGVLEMIVRRPRTDERQVLEVGELDRTEGLKGDNWSTRGSALTDDGSAHPDMQLNLMNSRVIALLAQDKERWQLAGDQLYVDMDLGAENLPPGSRLAIGTALIQVTAEPHTGCVKFAERFGVDAMRFVNTPIGRELSLRGINAKIVQSGVIRVGDIVRKV